MRETFQILTLLVVLVGNTVQPAYTVENVVVTVYRDGVAVVEINLYIEEDRASINLPLIGEPENLIVMDGSGNLLNFSLKNGDLKVYVLGSHQVKISYETQDLTYKSGKFWTVKFENPWKTKILLPQDVYVVGMNVTPEGFTASQQMLEVDMPPGPVEITYILEPSAPAAPTPFYTQYLVWFGVGSLTATIILLITRWQRKPKPIKPEKMLKELEYLRPEDQELLVFLRESGGQAFEAEIRSHFKLPKTTVWRMIKRLEREGLVEVVKIGGQNLVKLKPLAKGETGVSESS